LSKGNVPQLIAPILTFAIYIGISSRAHSTLDTTKLFTSLALILLASEPLFMLIGGLIELRSAIGCFARLEKFLQTPALHDTRNVVSTRAGTGSDLFQTNAVVIQNASFGWKEEDQFTIKNVSLCVPSSSVVMIAGPVACGKSTLLKGLLGETPLSEGRVEVLSSDIAWCEQSPWLMVSCRILQSRVYRPLTFSQNASIQRNIISFSELDPELYSSVIHACDLETDLEVLPKGDATMVGSKGSSLSGGQKQRIVGHLESALTYTSNA
jgi:ATP-binding cassette subfamily C (CFTR/MRP) protein 1